LSEDAPKSVLPQNKLTRRKYLQYTTAGIATVAVAGLGYLLSTPAANFDYKPKDINPSSADTVQFLNKSQTLDGTEIGLSYSWYVDEKIVASTRDFSTQLSSNSIGTQHRVRLSTCRGGLCGHSEKVVEVDPENDPDYPVQSFPDIRIKGVCYDAGTYYGPGADSTRRFITTERIEHEILDIANKELSCNGIRIYGSDNDRLLQCAEIATRGRFDVIALSPRYINADVDTTVTRVGEFASKCRELYRTNQHVSIIVANEATLDTRGFFEGDTLVDRNFNVGKEMSRTEWQGPLQEFLRRLVQECRNVGFEGPLSYATPFWERELPLDQFGFAYISDNHYWFSWLTEDDYVRNIVELNRFAIPYYMTEFGSVTFEGAHDYGGGGWHDYEGKKYSQQSQAESVRKYMDLFKKAISAGARIDACFWYNLADANANERDIESFALLKLNSRNQDNRYSRKKSFYAYKSYQRTA